MGPVLLRHHALAVSLIVVGLLAGWGTAAMATSPPRSHRAAEEPSSTPADERFHFESGQWSWLTGGVTLGLENGLNVQAMTYVGKHVKVTVLDMRFGWSILDPYTLDWHVGPVVGFGGHHGSRRQFSHWAITGAWIGGRLTTNIFRGMSSLTGLFLPVGYEFRHRFKPHCPLVWGLRLFIAYSPLNRNIVGPDTCKSEDDWLCGPGPKIELPIVTGLMVFFGF